jgi:hypothetical protein
MKRYLALAALLVLAAFAVFAEGTSTLTIQPSEMKDGETKTFTDDGRTITVKREGDTTHVTITDADKTERLTITREGNRLHIGRHDGEGFRSFVVGPDRKRIVIDGVPFGEFKERPLGKQMQSWFVCPKDKTMLRVPEGKEEQTWKCPVDGTVMEKRKGRGFTFFFDDGVFESNIL